MPSPQSLSTGLVVQLLGRPAARGRRRERLPLPQPQELGGAGVPAARRAPADAQPAGRRCCSPRPTTRCGRCGGAWPRSAAGSARRRRSTATRSRLALPAGTDGGRRRPRPRPLARRRRAARASAPTCSTASRIQHAAPFESWLLSRAAPARGGGRVDPARGGPGTPRRAATLDRARDLAVRAAVMSPLDENHQALLIRLYRLAGDDEAAERQYAAWAATARARARRAARAPRSGSRCGSGRAPRARCDATRRSRRSPRPARPPSSAGALGAGVASFETAVRLADQAGADEPPGRDPAGARRGADPHPRRPRRGGRRHADRGRADRRSPTATREAAARARAELGYVDFLRARYDRAERWLDQVARRGRELAVDAGQGDDLPRARWPATARTTRGPSPCCRRPPALSRDADEPRREAFGLSMLGRVSLLRGDLDDAAEQLARRRRPGRARPLALVPALAAGAARPGAAVPGRPRRAPPDASSSRSPGPARSATRAGRGSRPAGWPWWPRRRATSDRRLRRRCSTPARGPTAWPTPTSGSTSTSSTRCASSAVATATRRPPRWVDDDARPGVADRDAGADRAGHAARRRARGPRATPRPPRCWPPTSTTRC